MTNPRLVGCDRCGANKGEPCMTNRGLRPTRPHVARIRLALKVFGK